MGDVIARALAAACADHEVLARIGGRLGEAARDAASLLAGQSPDARSALRATWAVTARAPVPPGIRGVHPSWIEAGLAGLPERARAAVAAAAGPVEVWLARLACATIPPTPAIDPMIRYPCSAVEAVQMNGDAVARWLEMIGEDQLVFAVGAAGASAVSATAARLGRDLDAATQRIGTAPRVGALGSVRAAIRRSRVELDGRAVARIGARALAPRLDGVAAQQLAVRLPHTLGSVVLAELAAWTADPADDAPAWSALAATC